MKNLSIEQLNALRMALFDNAENLHKEAKILFENERYARAYLLAHYACEELGKIPIVVGVLGKLINGEAVDWKKATKRFRSHKAKLVSENHHHYVFGIELDLLNDSDIKWLKDKNRKSHSMVEAKNRSSYVDVIDGELSLPDKQFTKEDATEMIEVTFQRLKAHWQSESLTNPIIVRANNGG